MVGLHVAALHAEAIRGGIEAVPASMIEAARGMGFSQFEILRYVQIPLALRSSLPAIVNGLISLVKSTTVGNAIAVSEITYASIMVWTQRDNVVELMIVLLAFFSLIKLPHRPPRHMGERKLAVPGMGYECNHLTTNRVQRRGILRYIGFVAMPLLVVIWSLLDPTLGAELVKWVPYLASGFWMNIVITFSAVTLGTVAGVLLGLMQLAPLWLIRWPAAIYVQIFRNAPALVLIFATTYIFPFEIVAFGHYLPFPDWIKAVIGLGILASAYIAEITRGAVLSIPTTQWEATKGLGFSRLQALRFVILPQCIRRSLPPWMNVASSIAMGTSLASLVGVHELMHAATDASTAVRRLDFTVIAYVVVMAAFFTLCYPLSRLTRRLEQRFNAG